MSLIAFLVLSAFGPQVGSRPAGDTLAITNVAVIAMDAPGVLERQTVLVAGSRIIAVGPAGAVRLPLGARIVDGRGKYLVPGLADMHVHLSSPEELGMYVGNGVLTVRDLNGSAETLGWRQATASGTILGPRIIASGPMIAGGNIPWRNKVIPTSAADAGEIVVAQKAAGYDQIKIYDGLSKEVFDAAIAAAKRVGMPSSGHIPASVGFDGVVASGMNGLEHLDKAVFAAVGHDFDTLKIPSIVERISRSGMWVTPTLASMIQLARIASGGYDSLMARPEALAAPADVRAFWTSVTSRLKGNRAPVPGVKYNPFCDYQMRLASALARAGVPLLAGTDLPNAVLVPGYALHNELDALVESGLTTYQALESATIAPARWMREEREWGSVAVGRRANLVLAEKNPLDDLRTLADPAGVAIGGRWLERDELARLRKARPAR